MEKYKYLLKNIGLLTLGQFATKIMVFLLVPLYTNVLSTEEYGIYDLFSTTANLLMPILTLNVCEAVIIYTLDNMYDNKDVISIGLKYGIRGFCLSCIILLINDYLNIVASFKQFGRFLPLMVLLSSVSITFSYFARGIDCVKQVAISGVLSSFVLIACNIYFLLILKTGLLGYFWANIASVLVQILYLLFSCKIYRFIKACPSKKTEKEMKAYAFPLIANTIGWWVNNSSDRYIVSLLCGIAENGIYSVGYKIPSILNMFQTVFSQAWTISAIKDFDSEDKSNFFSNTYRMYNCCMVFVCSFIIITDRILASFLYAKDFFEAWKYVPWLTIAIVFNSLAGFLGGVFSATKNSMSFGKSTVIGAIVNFVLNIILVSKIQTLGAAIATTIACCVVWVIRMVDVQKYIRLNINLKRDLFAYIVLIVQGILLLCFNDGIVLFLLEMITIIGLFYAFRRELIKISGKIIGTFRSEKI